MRSDRKSSNHLLLGGAGLAVAALAGGFWLLGGNSPAGAPPAASGVVTVAQASAPASAPSPLPAAALNLPTAPDKVIAHVRETYPFLKDVDFGCDAKGCAVTATIPPPPEFDTEFLERRQDMLVGGLAKAVAADGYKALGPVQMDEVSFNTFRIRASVAQAR